MSKNNSIARALNNAKFKSARKVDDVFESFNKDGLRQKFNKSSTPLEEPIIEEKSKKEFFENLSKKGMKSDKLAFLSSIKEKRDSIGCTF